MLDTMHTHNFDAVRYARTADYDDAATFLNTFRTGDSENTSQYSNPAYDEALRNAAKASDVASRGKYYQQAEDLLAQDVPAIPVYHYVRTHLVKPRVGGFTPDKLGYYYTKDMYIKNTHPLAATGADFLRELPEIQTNNTKLFVFKAVEQNGALQHPPRCL